MSSFTSEKARARAANIDHYKSILRHRTVSHPQLCQEIHASKLDTGAASTVPFTFVIGADTQLGISYVSFN